MRNKGLEVTRKLEKSKQIDLLGYAEFVEGGFQTFTYRNAKWGLAPLSAWAFAVGLYKVHKMSVDQISATEIKQYLVSDFSITKLKRDMDLYLERKGG